MTRTFEIVDGVDDAILPTVAKNYRHPQLRSIALFSSMHVQMRFAAGLRSLSWSQFI
jgi:hypothetical protein